MQESYYSKIFDRYMQFCASTGSDAGALNRAFESLSFEERPATKRVNGLRAKSEYEKEVARKEAQTRGELSVILMAMRKLREGLIASGRIDEFAQQAYVFIIRASILSSTFESYQPALLHLINRIEPVTPLAAHELHEFLGYHILDLACRLGEYESAFMFRKKWNYKDDKVEGVLKALVHDDFISFWRLKDRVDGHQRKLMAWAEPSVRKHALKCLGQSYLSLDKRFVEVCGGRSWEELKSHDGIGWELDGQRVTVRRVRPKAK
jgi:hypothetical protein